MDTDIRQQVRSRAAGRCEYCRLPDAYDEWPFHVDHIVARVHGGTDEIENLCWSCTQCNLHKGPNLVSIDPDTGQRCDLFHPRHDLWRVHFALDPDGHIRGLTPIGRTTARLLNFNASPQLDLRRQLIRQGEYLMA